MFKKTITAILIVSMAALIGNAHAGNNLILGGGLNLSNMSGTDDYELEDNNMRIGINVGAGYRIALNEQMGLLTGLSFETRGYTMSEELMGVDIDMTVGFNYLQIPMLFSYEIAPGVAINVGPELGLFLGGKMKVEVEDESDEADLEDVSPIDLGLSFNGSFTIAEQFVISVGYTLGLLNTDNYDYEGDPDFGEDMDGAIKHNNIKLTVGYLLPMGE